MIDPNSIQSNSNKSRARRAEIGAEPEKKPVTDKKVVSGTVRSKKSNFKSLTNTFLSGDASKVKSHLINGVIAPAVKNVISSVIIDTVEMMIFGDVRGGRRSSASSRSSYDTPSYRDYYGNDRRRDNTRRSYENTTLRFDREDLVYNTIDDAAYVLDSMRDTLRQYPIVTVLDLYEFSDRKPPFTARNYGWTNLDGVEIKTIHDSEGIGYILTLRKPMPID